MPRYKIEWTVETFYETEVEAESFADATRKFWAGEYLGADSLGTQIQDSVEVSEI